MVCCENQNCCVDVLEKKENSSLPSFPDNRELTWIDVAGIFPTPQECLAAFFAVAAAEVISGAKPANMVRIPNQKLPCGRRMYRLWQKFGPDLLNDLPVSVRTMKTEKDSALLLIYRSDLLERRLSGKTMQTFLLRHGYPQPLTLEKTLHHLQESFSLGVPHEVGMFLGYPIKDVKGFMRYGAKFSHGRGLWRIYGPPARSLRLNSFYRSKRQEVIAKLAAGCLPSQLLQAA
jgi:hypothetical protein